MKLLNFLFLKRIIERLNKKIFGLMYFVMKITWFILPIYQIKNLETVRRIYWIITDENKSHYVCIKTLTDLCAITQKIILKNIFANIVYNVSVVKKS